MGDTERDDHIESALGQIPAAENAEVAGIYGTGASVLSAAQADVGNSRERQRRRRLWHLTIVLGIPAAFSAKL